jgi:serine/threonine protein kinase/tetratricopeptide (TPR) repeat protein
MRNQSDLQSTDLRGATGPKDESDVATRSVQVDPTERLKGNSVPGSSTEPRIDVNEAGRSETVDTPVRTDGETTAPGENVAALHFLAAADRPGRIGRLGPYEVLERIGQGGMGVVLKARDERLGRIVAIKMLTPALASSTVARRRFEREARAAAAVCHEHVVTIHAVDEDAGNPYLVMQFVAGQSLQEKLNRNGALGVIEIVRIGMQVASGLAAAHTQGLIHRDIKPANLLLENGVERVKITDFGLARAIDDASMTDTGTVLGTPHYMSPEQARGEPVDYRSDLFSLGSVLFAMCTGQPPFRAETTVAVLRKVSDDAAPLIRELNPDIPEWLAAIVVKLMAKDPRTRFDSAAEVAELLAHHLAQIQQPTTTVTVEPSVQAAPIRQGRHLARPQLVMLCGLIAMTVGIALWLASRWLAPSSAPVEVATRLPQQTRPAASAPANPLASSVSPGTAEDAKKALDLIAAGAQASSRGDIPKGIEDYTEALRLAPTNVKALLSRAHLQTDNRVMNWAGAMADATEVIRLDPKNAEAFESRAYAEYRAGDYRRTIEDATEALRLDPSRVEAYSHRGAAYKDLGEWKHAIVDLNESLSRAPNSAWPLMDRAVAYWSLGDVDHAMADINRAVERDPNVNHFRMFRAQIFARKKDYERAKTEYADGIRVSSEAEKYFAYQRRGEFEMSLSELDLAIADYTETIRRNLKMAETKDVSGYGARAHAYLAHGDIDRAIADCDEAMRINPKAPWVLPFRGFAYARKGQWDRAMADFDEEANRVPTRKPHLLVAKACVLALAGRYVEAAATFDAARQADEAVARGVLSARGFYFDRQRGDIEEAIKNLNLAEHQFWPPNVFLYRGIIYARLGQPERALGDFKKLMEIVEDSRRDFFGMDDFVSRPLVFRLGRGEAYLVKGDLEHALTDADEAVRFAPSSAEARLLRARVHDKRGKPDLADADRRAAAQLIPDPIVAPPNLGSQGGGNRR